MLFGLTIISWIAVGLSTDCIQREIDPTGKDYRGYVSRTATGHKCRIWGYQGQNFPGAGLRENLCRNPGNSYTAPWCHSDGPYGWGVCDIPYCEVKECVSLEKDRNGKKYRGTQNTDQHGNACLDWSDTKHSPKEITDAGLEDGNYCRNPITVRGKISAYRSRPWCYISKHKISYCDIPYCEDLEPTIDDDLDPFGLDIGCIPIDEDPTGAGYRGSQFTTRTGKVCREWEEFDRLVWPNNDLFGGVCRNPGGDDSSPWCHTGSNEWDYCDIPVCRERDLVCGADELMCVEVDQCISKEKNCDGVEDCDDGSDEKNCL